VAVLDPKRPDEGSTMHAHDTLEELAGEGRALRDLIPEVYSGYARMAAAVMSEGALSVKTKELIALAVAATRECDGCIAAHAKSAVRAGVSLEEAAEALGVVIMMNGGPGTVWGPRALAAVREYSTAP
jgi:AhpD family alkylhydroperoxidase